jgi:hypothetical protein
VATIPEEALTILITIVHGSQTGVDRGGHEAALDSDWRIAGYMPRDGRDELGRIPQAVAQFFALHDKPGFAARTEANVRTVAAALIVVAHNLCCVVKAIFTTGLAPTFWPDATARRVVSDLTDREQRAVRTALRFLRLRVGAWKPLVKALRYEWDSIQEVATGKRAVTPALALRVARFAGIPMDERLAGSRASGCRPGSARTAATRRRTSPMRRRSSRVTGNERAP